MPAKKTASKKTVSNTDTKGTKTQVKDVEFWGDGDAWKLICKASSQAEGWMKSTKAMNIGSGVMVQVTTQQDDKVAEAVAYAPNTVIREDRNDRGELIGRTLVSKVQ